MNSSDALLHGTADVTTRIGRTPDDALQQQRRRAVLAVAGNFAQDAEDCGLLLDMLGLGPAEGRVS